jgi:hypothetical protein
MRANLETVLADQAIHSLETEVRRRLGSRVSNLSIICCDKGVILEGRALTFHAKQLAQHTAMEVADLPILANNILVQESNEQLQHVEYYCNSR